MVVDKLKAINVHIPRTGGSSVFRTLDLPENNVQYRYIVNGIQEGHYTSKELLNVLGEDKFKEYFKFSFVRNPWDKMVSIYTVRGGRLLGENQKAKTFEHFLKDLESKYSNLRDFKHPDYCHFISMSEYLKDENGKDMVDHIGRFENYNQELETILKKLNKGGSDIKHVYKTKRNSDYKSYYNDTTIDIIGNLYENDLKNYNYGYGK